VPIEDSFSTRLWPSQATLCIRSGGQTNSERSSSTQVVSRRPQAYVGVCPPLLIFDETCNWSSVTQAHSKRLPHTRYPHIVELPKTKLPQWCLSRRTTLIKEIMAMWVFRSPNLILSREVRRALRALAVVVHMADKLQVGMGMHLRERRQGWVNFWLDLPIYSPTVRIARSNV